MQGNSWSDNLTRTGQITDIGHATNRPIEDWGVILGDNAATSAILDRFLDDVSIFNIKGKSYRMQKRKKGN